MHKEYTHIDVANGTVQAFRPVVNTHGDDVDYDCDTYTLSQRVEGIIAGNILYTYTQK